MSNLFEELKRRNVVRVGIAYVVVAWLILQFSDLVLENLLAPNWIMQTIMLILAIGLPIALLFAWAYELTPEGLKTTKEVDRSESVTHNTGRKLDRVIIGVLAIAVVYFLWERQQPTEVPASAEPVAEAEVPSESQAGEPAPTETTYRSIAVLPFVNMSSDEEQEWFADGLTEEILNSLARTPDLLVSARTSSFAYKNSTEDLPTIAAALGVEHVLEGSVRRSGDRLRVTAQLIRANDGFHLWSENFDRALDDVIEIQEQVAIEIAAALETAMDPEALAKMVSTGTRSVPAYEAYLRGLAYQGDALASGDKYQLQSAEEAFQAAVAVDPEFSLAHRQIASYWSTQATDTIILAGITELPREDILVRYHAAIDNAIRFEENSVRQTGYQADKARMELKFLQALRLNTAYLAEMPLDHDAQFLQMSMLREVGHYEEATEAVERYYELGVYNSGVIDGSITTLLDIGRPDLLEQYTAKALEHFGDDVNILYQAHRAQLWIGDIDGAALMMPTILSSDIDASNKHLVMLRQACAEGDTLKANRLYERGLVDYVDSPTIVWLSHTIMNRHDEALNTLMPFDDDNNFAALADFMSYGRFDATKFPNYYAFLESQGVEPHAEQIVPLACKSPTI